MSALLQTRSEAEPAREIGGLLRAAVDDWTDPGHVADAAARILAEVLRRPTVFIYRTDAAAEDLILLGVAPERPGQPPVGSRSSLDRSAVATAVREKTTHRALNQYVEADFVHSLPGETRSTLAVPIVLGDRTAGVIQLDYASPSSPSEADREAAEEVAERLAIAWAAASAAPSSTPGDGAPEMAAAIDTLASALAREDNYGETLRRVPTAALEVVGATAAVLLVKHSERQMLQVTGTAGAAAPLADALVPMDGTGVGQIFRAGKPVVTGGFTAEGDPLFPADLLPKPFPDALAVPVSSGGKSLGLLVVAGSRGGFGAKDVQCVQRLADLAGASSSLSLIAPLRQRISDAALIAEVGRAMTGTLGLDEVLALVVRSAEMLISGRSAGVAMLLDGGARMRLAAASGSLMTRTNEEFSTAESVLGYSAASGEILMIDDLSEDPRGWDFGENYGPAVIVPLESRGEIRGVLFAARGSGKDPLGDHDLDAVRKLSAYGAIAIENAILYKEQKELSGTLKAQAEELEKAYSELNASQERLLVSEKMAALGRVTAGIAHEINSPLGSILNCLQLASSYAEEYQSSAGDPDVTAEDHVAIATDILESLKLGEEAARRVAQFVRTIKGQTRMEDEQDQLFDPIDVAESTVLMFQHEIEDGPVSIETKLEEGITMKGDASKFALIVQNLVSNAVDAYDEQGGVVELTVRREGTDVVLEVEDSGSGIPEEIRPRIYDYLFTTKDVGSGTGLGLALVHSTVTSNFRGKVDFETEVGVGTKFTVTIPGSGEL